MVTINKLYKTKIDCSTYEPQIDSEDMVVTVTVLDFNNNPVSNALVNISTEKGYFIKKETNSTSEDIISKVTSMNAGSNGIVKFTYQASDWGFDTITVNNNTIQIFVTGWRKETPLYHSYMDDEMNNLLLEDIEYYVDESINHMILQGTMNQHSYSNYGATEKMGYLLFDREDENNKQTTISQEQTISTTQNTSKTYSVGLDSFSGASWSLEWDMKTSTTSAILCVGMSKYVDIGTSNFDGYISLGVWTDGNITVGCKGVDVPIDKTTGSAWSLNTWHHCMIDYHYGTMGFYCDDVLIDFFDAYYLEENYEYSLYLTSWKVGTVDIKNIVLDNYSSPYMPVSNIKNIIYRPDINIGIDSHGYITSRSEFYATPVTNVFRLEWNFINPNMNYIPSENYMD